VAPTKSLCLQQHSCSGDWGHRPPQAEGINDSRILCLCFMISIILTQWRTELAELHCISLFVSADMDRLCM
jgi:hypothetical protein